MQQDVAQWQPQSAAWTLRYQSCRGVMGISPRCGSHKAALITSSCDWTEVSLSHCIYHGGSAATPIFGAALVRSEFEFVSRTVKSAHRLPTTRRAYPV